MNLCNLPMREHRRKDRSDIAVFSLIEIAKTGLSVRTPLAYVSRKSWHMFCENIGSQ